MTYICPFCKQKMIHHPSNSQATKNEKLLVKSGDTFTCRCKRREGYNSWKFVGKDWFFLELSSDDWILKTKKNETPYFDFNPSRR